MPVNPWDQREDETNGAYRAFLAYLNLGRNRTLNAASLALKPERIRNKRATNGTIGKWSSQHDWVARAAAWDNHQDAERQRGRDQEARRQGELWERRRYELAERNWEDARLMAQKARELADMPVIRRRISEDGQTVWEPIGVRDLKYASDVLVSSAEMARETINFVIGPAIPTPNPPPDDGPRDPQGNPVEV